MVISWQIKIKIKIYHPLIKIMDFFKRFNENIILWVYILRYGILVYVLNKKRKEFEVVINKWKFHFLG